MKYKEGSVLIKDIQCRFSQGLEVYSIMTAAVSTMTATFFNYPKKVATMLWNGRQPWCRICILFIRSVFLFESLSLFTENTEVSFNPLFIRSVFLLGDRWHVLKLDSLFQFLIHQVSVSFSPRNKHFFGNFLPVSIPYSSGQCFFSFLDSLYCKSGFKSFNPLFIRSVFLLQVKG